MKIAIALILAIAFASIAFFAIRAPGPFSKDYRFPRVEIDATVRPDGALVLDEHRTFAFEGDFTFAYFTVEWPLELLQEFSISENGQPFLIAPFEDQGAVRADWTFEASNEERTFDIHYVALCAVDVGPDTAHLNWQFVGTSWEKATDFLHVRVHLPPAAKKITRPASCPGPPGEVKATRPLREGEVRAWGHGPLAGEVRIPDPQTVELMVPNLQPATFVEGSIVFPEESVPLAPQDSGRNLASIVFQEEILADLANSTRRRHDLEVGFTWVLFFLLPAFLVAMVMLARRRDLVPGVPSHLNEPPEEIHPVELAVLWSTSHGSLSPKTAYRAQLLHLAQTGAIEVTPVGPVSDPDDFQLRLVKQPEDMDREFVGFLFAEDGQGPISLERVKAKGSRRDRLTSWWKRVGEKTKRSVETVVKGRNRTESKAAFLFALGAALYGYWRSVGFNEGPVLFDGFVGAFAAWLVPEAIVTYLVARRFIPSRLSGRLRERLAKWTAFRRYLTDFSTFDDAPAAAITIWEHYLVYATALGVADEVEKQVRALVPAERLPEPWPGAPSGEDGYVFYSRSIGSSPSHVASNAASAVGWSSGWGSSSSGGGGGGGFSGGGGGGG
ncbi:MAG: DUF2207 family protein, partial [Actinomycetota bacterium]